MLEKNGSANFVCCNLGVTNHDSQFKRIQGHVVNKTTYGISRYVKDIRRHEGIYKAKNIDYFKTKQSVFILKN